MPKLQQNASQLKAANKTALFITLEKKHEVYY